MSRPALVHVRAGASWKQDPALRAELGRGGEAAARAAAAAVGTLALEADGVDVASGRAEGALLPGLEALARSVLGLVRGRRHVEVHFAEGAVLLLLTRAAERRVLLTVVSLTDPSRLLAHAVEVDLGELASAVAGAALELASDLSTLAPGSGGALRSVAALLGRARPAPLEGAPAAAPGPESFCWRGGDRAGDPSCAVELLDGDGVLSSYRGPEPDLGSLLAPGRVTLSAAGGPPLAALPGIPFLTMRELSSAAGRLAEAVHRRDPALEVRLAGAGRAEVVRLRLDLVAGTARHGGHPPLACPPLGLARALLQAALGLCQEVVARHAPQAGNAWLRELRASSEERLLHVEELTDGDVPGEAGEVPGRSRRQPRLSRAPLGPGRLRRLAFRRSWEADVGPPCGFGLATAGDLLVAAGSAAVLGLDARTGAVRWRLGGASGAELSEGVLHLHGQAGLCAVDALTGRERWRRPAAELGGQVRRLLRLQGGLGLALSPTACFALDPLLGADVWSFAPPAGRALRAASLFGLAVVGSGSGFAYGLEAATGRLAWRARLPGPPAALPVAAGDHCLVTCATPLGGALVALDPSSGRRRFEVALDITPSGPPVHCAGLLAVPGTVAGDAMLAAVDPAGALAWESTLPIGPGAPALTEAPGGLLAKASDGSCAALDRSGAVVWAHPGHEGHPPPANPAPVLARGLALVPGEAVEALVAATGERMGRLPLVAPVRFRAGPSLDAWGLDAAGVVTATRLETHLSLVGGG